MLLELAVQNLLLIEEARLELAPGLNVLTGETGAGKTILAHALDLLLGGRARPGIVRPGCSEAYVEGVFELPEGFAHEQLSADASELVLARRVGSDGRTRATLGGRAITLAELRELAGSLLAFYGQHEHRRLMLADAQLEILDGAGGAAQLARRARCAAAWRAVLDARARFERASGLAAARDRELDLLEFELAEIEQVAPSVPEREQLEADRRRMRGLAALQAAAASAERALGEEERGALAAAVVAAASLDGAASLDPRLDALATRARALSLECEDLLGELRGYLGELDEQPVALEELEERLAAITRLERKHGGSVAAVLEQAESLRARRDELRAVELLIERAQSELEHALAEHRSVAAELSAARALAAPALTQAVDERLAALGMERAGFAVELVAGDGGPRGSEHARFLIAPNPGVPAAPLREIASGGELSRVMLALLGAAHGEGAQAPETTLVFDEIDAGIGGHTARSVGEQLRALAAGRQILAITHLPQVASFAARHFTIAKRAEGELTTTFVHRLEGAELVEELVRMLGGGEDDAGARRHARELLRAA